MHYYINISHVTIRHVHILSSQRFRTSSTLILDCLNANTWLLSIFLPEVRVGEASSKKKHSLMVGRLGKRIRLVKISRPHKLALKVSTEWADVGTNCPQSAYTYKESIKLFVNSGESLPDVLWRFLGKKKSLCGRLIQNTYLTDMGQFTWAGIKVH